ncbi:MAG TPA: hypothetical protein VGQ87_01905 [Patescibacteria group bacterium]|jgi:hypothetical protein|nr:hypothetical protein [Patescibacteria group bacterium]
MINGRKSWAVFLPAILILMFFQAALSAVISFRSVPADLVLVFIAAAALALDLGELLPIAIFSGLVYDITSPATDGVLTLAFIITASSLYFLVVHFFPKQENRLIPAALTIIATVLFYVSSFAVAYGLSLLKLGNPLSFRYLFFERIWIELIFNLIFLYPMLIYFRLWENIALKIENKINR